MVIAAFFAVMVIFPALPFSKIKHAANDFFQLILVNERYFINRRYSK